MLETPQQVDEVMYRQEGHRGMSLSGIALEGLLLVPAATGQFVVVVINENKQTMQLFAQHSVS